MRVCFHAIKRVTASMVFTTGLLTLVFSLSACSSLGSADQASIKKIPLHEQDATKVANSALHAIVVVYRQGAEGSEKIGDPAYPPVNLYVNGDYHSSLRPRSQIELTLCAGSQRLYPLLDNASTALADKSGKGTAYDLKPGSKQYFRVVVAADGKTQLELVKLEEAQRELTSSAQKSYTLSRFHIAKACAK